MKPLVPAVVIALAGCAAPSPSEDSQTIEQFVSNFSGKELRLQFPMPSDAFDPATLSGARDAVYGYAGLKQAYGPARKHCESGGGTLRIVEQRAFSKAGASLPVRFQCRADDKVTWELSARYMEQIIPAEKSGRTIMLTPQASLSGTADLANRRASRIAAAKPEQRPSAKERTRLRAATAEKPAPEKIRKTSKSEDLKLFRKNLKPGDRVQWKTAATPAKSVGQVVRLNGDLALVQFDNQALAGQSLRYFNRSQLEPFDGVVPMHVAR